MRGLSSDQNRQPCLWDRRQIKYRGRGADTVR